MYPSPRQKEIKATPKEKGGGGRLRTGEGQSITGSKLAERLEKEKNKVTSRKDIFIEMCEVGSFKTAWKGKTLVGDDSGRAGKQDLRQPSVCCETHKCGKKE